MTFLLNIELPQQRGQSSPLQAAFLNPAPLGLLRIWHFAGPSSLTGCRQFWGVWSRVFTQNEKAPYQAPGRLF